MRLTRAIRPCICPGSPERQNQQDVIEKEIYSKELVRVTVEARQSKIFRAGRQAGDPGKSRSCSSSPEAVSPAQFSLAGGGRSFVL